MAKKIRKFNGKNYKLYVFAKDKSTANFHKKIATRKGFNVRIIKYKKAKRYGVHGKGGYALYIREK